MRLGRRGRANMVRCCDGRQCPTLLSNTTCLRTNFSILQRSVLHESWNQFVLHLRHQTRNYPTKSKISLFGKFPLKPFKPPGFSQHSTQFLVYLQPDRRPELKAGKNKYCCRARLLLVLGEIRLKSSVHLSTRQICTAFQFLSPA